MVYKNKEKQKETYEAWKKKHPHYARNLARNWEKKHPKDPRNRINWKKYRVSQRQQVLNHYSNGQLKCACCGESQNEFLTIDHINGGGYQQRKKLKIFGTAFFHWLIKNNFPEGFQVLCMNCNWGKARNNGVCPHKKQE